MINTAVIGGSGLYNLDSFKEVDSLKIETPFGETSDHIKVLESPNREQFYFLARHGQGHKINPSEINYRANVFALKKLGTQNIVSVSAVGSLKEDYEPGHFVVPDQFMDWTRGFRKKTFFENGIVGHVSAAELANKDLQGIIAKSLKEADVTYHEGGTYICIEGPQFSSKAESNLYRSFNADIIGMTNLPEAFLVKEAGMAYATVAMVTDYDCWKEEHCTVEEIMKIMSGNFTKAQNFLERFIPMLLNSKVDFVPENKYAIVSKQDGLSEEQREILNTLI